MATKAASANGTRAQDAKFAEAIEECVGEMKEIRKSMKKTDAEIRRLQISTRQNLDQTWEILRDVKASH
ncbi:MAG: hypothetical protein HY298_03630 [Verrucomicrobia bacterium]|nr:hypothetical protein [Verrucomicrobiota bacterium]